MKFNKLPIIFVQGAGRTGFDLLRTLLDGHEEVLIFPFTDKFTANWKINNLSENSSIDELVKKLLYGSKIRSFKEKFYLNAGTIHDYSDVDWQNYIRYFREFFIENKVNSRNARLAIYYALARTINVDLNKLSVLVADGYYNDQTQFILQDFPKARFLHLVKDHRAHIFSLKEYYRKANGTMYPVIGNVRNMFLHVLMDNMHQNMRMLDRNKLNLGNKLKVLKYENLLIEPKETLNNLSHWLGIEYNDGLLKTTRIGKPSNSNSAFNEKPVTGINPEFAFRWKRQMSAYEIRMIEYLFGRSMLKLGYEKVYPLSVRNKIIGFLSCFLPWKGEIFPHQRIIKNTNFQINPVALWKYFKYGIYLFNGILGYICSRFYLFYYILSGKFKAL